MTPTPVSQDIWQLTYLGTNVKEGDNSDSNLNCLQTFIVHLSVNQIMLPGHYCAVSIHPGREKEKYKANQTHYSQSSSCLISVGARLKPFDPDGSRLESLIVIGQRTSRYIFSINFPTSCSAPWNQILLLIARQEWQYILLVFKLPESCLNCVKLRSYMELTIFSKRYPSTIPASYFRSVVYLPGHSLPALMPQIRIFIFSDEKK